MNKNKNEHRRSVREANQRYWRKMSMTEKLAKNQERYRRYIDNYRRNRKKWEQENPHKCQASTHNATVRNRYPEIWAKSTITNSELAEWLLKYRGTECVYCGDPAFHIDHKIPLSKGGQHDWSNLQMCCEFCNLAKRHYSEEDFMKKIRQIGELQKIRIV